MPWLSFVVGIRCGDGVKVVGALMFSVAMLMLGVRENGILTTL